LQAFAEALPIKQEANASATTEIAGFEPFTHIWFVSRETNFGQKHVAEKRLIREL
jgi:hypothetical protein